MKYRRGLAEPSRLVEPARRRPVRPAPPMILGCDAAGIDAEGREVIVHSVIGSAQAGGGDETFDPDAVCCPSDTKAPSRNGSPCRR